MWLGSGGVVKRQGFGCRSLSKKGRKEGTVPRWERIPPSPPPGAHGPGGELRPQESFHSRAARPSPSERAYFWQEYRKKNNNNSHHLSDLIHVRGRERFSCRPEAGRQCPRCGRGRSSLPVGWVPGRTATILTAPGFVLSMCLFGCFRVCARMCKRRSFLASWKQVKKCFPTRPRVSALQGVACQKSPWREPVDTRGRRLCFGMGVRQKSLSHRIHTSVKLLPRAVQGSHKKGEQ